MKTRLSNRARATLAFARIKALSQPATPPIHRAVGSDLFLNIRGPILRAKGDENGVTLDDVQRALAANKRVHRIHVRINSDGGSVDDGDAIRAALRRHGAYVTTVAEQVCASAATLVLLAGDFRMVTRGSLLLLHQASIDANGRWTSEKHRRIAQKLDRANAKMAAAYAAATGRPVQRFQTEMANESLLPLSRARALNLIHCFEGEERWIAGRPHWTSSSPEEFISARLRDYAVLRSSLAGKFEGCVVSAVAFSKLADKLLSGMQQ